MFVASGIFLVLALPTSPDYYNPQFLPGWFLAGVGFDLVVGGGILIWIIRIIRREHRHWERWVRMDHFARINGFNFSPSQSDPDYPGAIFSRGVVRAAQDHFDTTSGRFLDIGNFATTESERLGPKTTTWGFLALSLDRVLPQMLLISHDQHGVLDDRLPITPVQSQALHLEGDFDKYFTLYCPPDYQADALYVFAPDLMALLIDELGILDVEIIDRWMFVYSPTPFDMTSPAVLQRLFRIADTVGAKTLSQTEHYSDAHAAAAPTVVAPAVVGPTVAAPSVAAPTVAATSVAAPTGARLNTRFPLRLRVSLIVVGALVGLQGVAALAFVVLLAVHGPK